MRRSLLFILFYISAYSQYIVSLKSLLEEMKEMIRNLEMFVNK